MHLPTAITLLVLKTAIIVEGQNVTFTNTTTIITTVITSTINNGTNVTMPPAPPPNVTTSATTPTTTSSRMTTLPSVSSTWGPLLYCWFPCYGGCGSYSLPQYPPNGGYWSWWFGLKFQWSRRNPRQQNPCSTGGRNRRRKGC